MGPLRTAPRPGGVPAPVVKNPNPPGPQQPRPQRLAEFPDGVQEFVEKAIRPRLTPSEERELASAEGKPWPDLARTIREKRPELPVVLTSGYSEVLADEGTHGFPLVRKPYSLDVLSNALREAFAVHAAGQ